MAPRRLTRLAVFPPLLALLWGCGGESDDNPPNPLVVEVEYADLVSPITINDSNHTYRDAFNLVITFDTDASADVSEGDISIAMSTLRSGLMTPGLLALDDIPARVQVVTGVYDYETREIERARVSINDNSLRISTPGKVRYPINSQTQIAVQTVKYEAGDVESRDELPERATQGLNMLPIDTILFTQIQDNAAISDPAGDQVGDAVNVDIVEVRVAP